MCPDASWDTQNQEENNLSEGVCDSLDSMLPYLEAQIILFAEMTSRFGWQLFVFPLDLIKTFYEVGISLWPQCCVLHAPNA